MRESVIRDHVDDYWTYEFESHDDLDEDTVQQYEERSNTALEVFQALFADREEFADEDSTEQFLSGAQDKGRQYLVDKFLIWTTSLLLSLESNENLVHCNADTVEELADDLEPFTKTVITLEGEPPVPSPWPIVEIVR